MAPLPPRYKHAYVPSFLSHGGFVQHSHCSSICIEFCLSYQCGSCRSLVRPTPSPVSLLSNRLLLHGRFPSHSRLLSRIQALSKLTPSVWVFHTHSTPSSILAIPQLVSWSLKQGALLEMTIGVVTEMICETGAPLQWKSWVKSKHDMYLMRGSVGALSFIFTHPPEDLKKRSLCWWVGRGSILGGFDSQQKKGYVVVPLVPFVSCR